MSKEKLALKIAEDLRSIANSIEALVGIEKDTEESIETKEEEKAPPKVTFNDLRTVLAVITRDGKQSKVKELIEKYGAKKLSDVAEEHYHELLEEARKI